MEGAGLEGARLHVGLALWTVLQAARVTVGEISHLLLQKCSERWCEMFVTCAGNKKKKLITIIKFFVFGGKRLSSLSHIEISISHKKKI